MSDEQASDLLARIDMLAKERQKKVNGNYEEALKQIAGEIEADHRMQNAIDKRNRLLTIQARRRANQFVANFVKAGGTAGEGLRAMLVGSNKVIQGARNSIDFQAKSIHAQYFGDLVARLEEAQVFSEFRKGELEKEIYIEMGEFGVEGGRPGRSGSPKAAKIAKAIEESYNELIARQNRAGGYIKKQPGYITRQRHNQSEIRRAGKDKEESFEVWSKFVMPLLDPEKTFQGFNPRSYLRKIHEGLHSGVHGAPADEAEIDGFRVHGSMAKKISQSRVLHFKDSESAYAYNQRFGTKHMRDSVLSDILSRSRSIALMENLGPNPRNTFDLIKQDLGEQARQSSDASRQVDSVNADWKLEADFNEVSGTNDIPQNVTAHRVMSNIRIVAQLSKMGGVVLSSLGDKAFLQVEAMSQGISNMQTLGRQLTGMAPRTPDQKRRLRLMGVAMDGLMGNVLNRYSVHSGSTGSLHRLQQKFFDLNFMNWWNDANKATAGELFAANVAEHADLPFESLPGELRNVFTQFDLSRNEWNALRTTRYETESGAYITPDRIKDIDDKLIDIIINEKNLKVTPANRSRIRTQLETKYRTYLQDSIDVAVPTPGTAQKKYSTWNTQSGTPLGEAMRTLMLFKSFPITVMTKVLGRHIYGNGSMTFKHWLAHDHKGKFHIAQLIAMTTIGGYLSGTIKDALKGRTPKPLINDDGSVNAKTLNDAMLRGGGMGILGDFLFTEYDRQYNSFLGAAAGPVFGQLDPLLDITTKLRSGENIARETEKFVTNNTPFVNLFYIRPVLDYFILWNIREMSNPGSLKRSEEFIEEENRQSFFIRPSEVVRERN